MHLRITIAVLLFLPLPASAQAPAERLLPSRSQVYLRFDGMQAHQAAYRQTVAGKLMDGELGAFLRELGRYTVDLVQRVAQNQPEAGPWIDETVQLLGGLYDNGLVLGVELQQGDPAAVHGVIVVPKAAGASGTLLPLLRKIVEAHQAEPKSVKVGKRFVHQLPAEGPVRFGWWAEADDAVLYVGTQEPAAYVRDIDAGKTGVERQPLYLKVRDFKDFTTATRGYIDLGAVAGAVAAIVPPARELIDELGLAGPGSVTFVSGFDGPAQRAVVEIDAPDPRKGLWTMGSRKTIRLQDLPLLPSDATSIGAGSMDLGKSYDVILKLAVAAVKIYAPEREDTVKEGVKTVEALLGVDLKADIFDNFGQLYVSYSSPSEGLLGLGAVTAVAVKDGKKLVDALERMSRAAGFVPGLELNWRKQDYKGGKILELSFKFNESSSHITTFGLYRDWFLVAQFPQAIKGFILRGNGELPGWQAEEKLAKLLTQFPKDYNGVSISDPRPTIEGLLVVSPLVLNLLNSVMVQALPGVRPFDISLVPHAQATTQSLFPSVTITTDDGRVIRRETRTAFP
jgi:hypothetical protein